MDTEVLSRESFPEGLGNHQIPDSLRILGILRNPDRAFALDSRRRCPGSRLQNPGSRPNLGSPEASVGWDRKAGMNSLYSRPDSRPNSGRRPGPDSHRLYLGSRPSLGSPEASACWDRRVERNSPCNRPGSRPNSGRPAPGNRRDLGIHLSPRVPDIRHFCPDSRKAWVNRPEFGWRGSRRRFRQSREVLPGCFDSFRDSRSGTSLAAEESDWLMKPVWPAELVS